MVLRKTIPIESKPVWKGDLHGSACQKQYKNLAAAALVKCTASTVGWLTMEAKQSAVWQETQPYDSVPTFSSQNSGWQRTFSCLMSFKPFTAAGLAWMQSVVQQMVDPWKNHAKEAEKLLACAEVLAAYVTGNWFSYHILPQLCGKDKESLK